MTTFPHLPVPPSPVVPSEAQAALKTPGDQVTPQLLIAFKIIEEAETQCALYTHLCQMADQYQQPSPGTPAEFLTWLLYAVEQLMAKEDYGRASRALQYAAQLKEAGIAPSLRRLRLLDKKGSQALSEREREVLELMQVGAKNGEMATHLGIAYSTVLKHVGRIFAKLHARNRTEAIYKYGLLLARGVTVSREQAGYLEGQSDDH